MLTSTMSSKHSYARSGERGEKREDGQQGKRKSGERRGTWGKESEQTIRQNTGGRRGGPNGTLLSPLSSLLSSQEREKRGEERGEQRENRAEQNRRGEKREKVRRRRRAPRNDLRERTEKVAKVVSHVHVNEMAEQKTDRSDLTAVTPGASLASPPRSLSSWRPRQPAAWPWRLGASQVCSGSTAGRPSLARRPENREPNLTLDPDSGKTGTYLRASSY